MKDSTFAYNKIENVDISGTHNYEMRQKIHYSVYKRSRGANGWARNVSDGYCNGSYQRKCQGELNVTEICGETWSKGHGTETNIKNFARKEH